MKTEVIKLYENRDDVTLATYILQDSPELLAGKTRPAVIICPGGGYFNCSDRRLSRLHGQMDRACRMLVGEAFRTSAAGEVII